MKRHVKNKVFSALISQLLVAEPLLKIFMLATPTMFGNLNGADAVVPSTATAPAATIRQLDVQCAENGMNVLVEFNQPFNGVIFSKGYYNDQRCVYANRPNSKSIQFSISSGSCGTVVGKFNRNSPQQNARVKRDSPFAVSSADDVPKFNSQQQHQLDFGRYNNDKFELLARNSLHGENSTRPDEFASTRSALPVIHVAAVESIRPVITLQHPFSLSPGSDDALATTPASSKVFSNDSSLSAQFIPSTVNKNTSQLLPPIVIIDAMTTKQNPNTVVNATELNENSTSVTKTHVVIVVPQPAAPVAVVNRMQTVDAQEKELAADAAPKTAKNVDEARLLESIHNVKVPVVESSPSVPREVLNERQIGQKLLKTEVDLSGLQQTSTNSANNNNVEHLDSALTERANPMDTFDTDQILVNNNNNNNNNRNKLQGRGGNQYIRGGSSLPSALDPRIGDPMAGPLLDDLNAEASRVMPDQTRDVPDVPSYETLHSRMSIKQRPSKQIALEATGAAAMMMSPRTNIHVVNDEQHRTSRIRFGGGRESDDMSIIFSDANEQKNLNRKSSMLDLRAPTSGQQPTGEKPIEPAGFGADMELSVLGDVPDGDKNVQKNPRQRGKDSGMFDKVGLVRRLPENLNFPPMPPPPNNNNGGRPLQQRDGMYPPPGIGGGFFGGNGDDGIALIGKGGGALRAKTNLHHHDDNSNNDFMDNGGYGHFGSLASSTTKDGKPNSNSQNGFPSQIMTGILAANGGRAPPNGRPHKILDLRAPYGGGPENDAGDPGFSNNGRYFQQPMGGRFAGFGGPAGGGLQQPNAGAMGTSGINLGGGIGNGQYLNLRAPGPAIGPERDDSDPGFAGPGGRYFNAPNRNFPMGGPMRMGGFNGRPPMGPFNGGGGRFNMPMMNGEPQATHFGAPGGQNPNALTSRQIFPPQQPGGFGGGPPPSPAPGQIATNNKFSPGFDPGFGTFDAGKNQFLDSAPVTNSAAGGGKGSGLREANPNFDVDSLDVPEPNGAAFGDFNEPGASKFGGFDGGMGNPNFGGSEFPGGGGGRAPLQQFINNRPPQQQQQRRKTVVPADRQQQQQQQQPAQQKASTHITVQTGAAQEMPSSSLSSSSSSGVVVINSSQQQPKVASKISPQNQQEIASTLQVLVDQEAQQADQRLRDEAKQQKERYQNQQQQATLAPISLLTKTVLNTTSAVPIESRLNFLPSQLPSIDLPSLELEQPSVTNIVLPSVELQQQSTSNVIVVPPTEVRRPQAAVAQAIVLPSLESQMQQLQSTVARRELHKQDDSVNIRINSQKFVAPPPTTTTRASTTTTLPPPAVSSTYNSNANDYIENIIIIQNDPDLQEVFDVARALRCEWRNSYRKTVGTESRTSDGLPVGAMLQTIMADVEMMRFTGDDVDIWMQLKSGKGPDAQPVSGIVPLGHPMTLVVGLNDPKNEFDLRVGRCQANDGNGHKILLTDEAGCVIKTKVMRPFEKARNWGVNKATIAFSEFSAFKFPEKTEVYIECDVEACKGQCGDMCPRIGVQRLQLGRGLANDDAEPRSTRTNDNSTSSTESSTTTAISSSTLPHITLSAMRKRRSVGTAQGKNSTSVGSDDDEQLKSLRSMYKAVSHDDLAFNFAPELLQLDSTMMEQLVAMGTSSTVPAVATEAQRAADSDPSTVSVCVTRTTLIVCVALGSTLATIAVVLLLFIVGRAWKTRRRAVAAPREKFGRHTKEQPDGANKSSKTSSNRMVVGRY